VKRFDVYTNPNERFRNEFPFVVIVQSDLLDEFGTRAVVPLARSRHAPNQINPVIDFAGEELVFCAQLIAAIPAQSLNKFRGNVGAAHSIIFRALDFLLSGF
jgi:toxin CcdB